MPLNRAGIELLKADLRKNATHYSGEIRNTAIFGLATDWPWDLFERYDEAESEHDHVTMAEIACEALDRVLENGKITQLEGGDNEL